MITTAVVRSAGDLAESDQLRGYDAVHLAAGIASGVTVFASTDDWLLSGPPTSPSDVNPYRSVVLQGATGP